MAVSTQTKESIISKALSRGDTPLRDIAQQNNVGYSTIQRWIREHGTGNYNSNTAGTKIEEKLNHIIATANLDDVSLGAYCRQHGLYSHQLTQWRNDMITTSSNKNGSNKQELKLLKKENKKLQKELKRKDKALAEVSALLILKKKADLIWGKNEED